MSKVMLVNVTHVEETRVATLEDGVLDAYDIETINRLNLKGNIHNAVVETTHPTLEAAFVRIGPDLKGFLPLDEVNFKLLPVRSDNRKAGKIGQHLHAGQKIMVQVVREPFAGKPPSVSTYFSLPGRYLVLMPGVDSSGVSRKIDDAKQRDRLKKIVDELNAPEGFGVIVRTAGMGQNKTELQRDLRYLLRLWESIQRASKAGEFPGLVYREADLVIRTIRDHLTPDVDEVWVDSKDTYEKALAFVRDVMPNRAKVLKLYAGDRPLFNKYNLEEQIERIYKRRVPLPSGGEIVIDGTEALTAVDVNSARSKRSGDIEETITQTNLEAAAEIARQMRLRDLGGLIVVDFIDMMAARNKKRVEKAMRDAMRGDRAKYDITSISKLGLMEMARQRIKGAKMAASYATCHVCDGYGLVKNVETSALAALRKLQTRSTRSDIGRVRVMLPPEVATWLLNHKREELVRVESRHHLRVEIIPRESMLRHECEFEAFPHERVDAAGEPASGDESASAPATTSSRPPATITARESDTPPPPDGRAVAVVPPPVPQSAPNGAGAGGSPDPRGESPDPATAAEPAAGRNETGETGERVGRRRRRRRRRRPSAERSGAPDGEGAERPQETGERGAAPRPAEPPKSIEEDVTPEVPVGVRADELMPAASGGRRGSGDGGGTNERSGNGRRRRRGGRGGSRGGRPASGGES